jgi:type I restriction enzyme M protein
MNLNSTIKSIQDIMRKDDGVDGDAQRIGQLTWMLFLKVLDQQEEEWESQAKSRGKRYKSPLPNSYRWRNWAAYKNGKPQIAAGELIDFVNTKLFPKLKAPEDSDDPMRGVIRQVFEDSNNYMKSGTLMLGVVEKLDEAINFHDLKTRQNLGDIYEQILNDLRAAGNAGEFYTPRAITQIMVRLVDPRLSEGDRVLDPACGTGGFLTATIDYLTRQLVKRSGERKKRPIESCISGFEKKQLPHLLCTTNLLLHGIEVPSQVTRLNTLEKSWLDWTDDERVECVITNPPFGGLESDEVGADYPPDLRTRETADMFLTLIVHKLLKDGGRGAIVLPDSALFGDGIKARIKRSLLETCNLHTIVRLPNGVFSPYTGIKTNLLFFTKGKPTETIWFYQHPYPKGQRSYSKTKPIRLEEFDDEIAWWGQEEDGFADRKETERAWKIDFKSKKLRAEEEAKPLWDRAQELLSEAAKLERQARGLRDAARNTKDLFIQQPDPVTQVEELRRSAEKLRLEAKDVQAAGDRVYWPIYNLDIDNPATAEEVTHDPDVLLEKYKRLLLDIEATQEQLKGELGEALAHHFEQTGG